MMEKGLTRWMERERRPFCRLEKVDGDGRIEEEEDRWRERKRVQGTTRVMCYIDRTWKHPPFAAAVWLASFSFRLFFFFFCSFRWLFMQRASIKTLERILLASLCNRVFFDAKFFVIIGTEFFRNYW